MVTVANNNNIENISRSTLNKERDYIKTAMKVRLSSGSSWCAISADWFTRWKQFVDFDMNLSKNAFDSSENCTDYHPGPIDNSMLVGNYPEELKKGIVEDVDYVLIPEHAADILYKAYTGGPKFAREVINIGPPYSVVLQVNLFPIRVEIYHCNKNQTEPIKTDPLYFHIHYFNKTADLEKVINQVKLYFRISSVSTSVRVWWKDQSKETVNLETDYVQDSAMEVASPRESWNSDDHYTNSVSKKARTRMGRVLTSDLTDCDGQWVYLRNFSNVMLSALLGNNDVVELIIESALGRSPLDTDWGRHPLLEKWKSHLKPGDYVDARDKSRTWYEAIVESIDEQGNLKIHFRGWNPDEFDEIIPVRSINDRIRPLYTETKNRSLWEDGQFVEVKVSEPNSKAVWLPVKIVDVEKARERIQIQYTENDKAEALEKYADIKRIKSVNSDDWFNPNASDDKKKQNQVILEWYDIWSEDICPLYTHTPKPDRNVINGRSNLPYNYTSSIGVNNNYNSLTSMTSSPSYDRYDFGDKHTKGTPDENGAVGLMNLGNTCFMNSILQCVSNTRQLTELFINNGYKHQLNLDNPLGHSGKLAQVYAKLIKDMWSGSYTRIVPREFKTTIGEFQPQFAGYEQQDSQEFMGFLLDGLHEDLNRVVKKPHVNKIESNGRDDVLIANESWRRYLLRNDSELVDRCFGLMKSHVTCVNCGKESVTFDAYSSLSLPIPILNTRILPITVQLLPSTEPPIQVDVELEITASMSKMKSALINKLIEHRLLSPIYKTAVKAPVEIEVCPSPMTNDDNGYEIVQMSDIEPTLIQESVTDDNGKGKNKDDYDIVSHNDASSSTQSSSSTAIDYDKYYFHFSTLFQSRPSNVWKNHDQDSDSTTIHQFVGKTDNLIAFQFEQDLPLPKPAYNSYSYNRKTSGIEEVQPESNFFMLDVCVGWKIVTTYGGIYSTNTYERIEMFGNPYRLSLPKGVTTNRHVYEKIWPMMRRYIREDSSKFAHDNLNDLQELPFDLIITNSYGSYNKSIVEVNDKQFEISGTDIVVVLWKSDVKDDHFDADQIKAIRLINDNKKATSDDDNSNDDSSKRLNISKCLDKFTEREQLAPAETVYCSNCKQHLAPIKKMDIWSAPDILILHLKRFQYIPGQYFIHREKINELIDFPISDFDLSNYVIGPKDVDAPPIYDLYAVSHHSGGLGGGHYTATCKNYINNKWYNFNDASVSETQASNAVSPTAYVLFYKRRTGSLKWAGVTPSSSPIPDGEA
eukprot:gene5667-7824_t